MELLFYNIDSNNHKLLFMGIHKIIAKIKERIVRRNIHNIYTPLLVDALQT